MKEEEAGREPWCTTAACSSSSAQGTNPKPREEVETGRTRGQRACWASLRDGGTWTGKRRGETRREREQERETRGETDTFLHFGVFFRWPHSVSSYRALSLLSCNYIPCLPAVWPSFSNPLCYSFLSLSLSHPLFLPSPLVCLALLYPPCSRSLKFSLSISVYLSLSHWLSP